MKVLCLSLIILFGCQTRKSNDLVLTNANVITVNDKQPAASDVAIIDGKIIYVGDSIGIKKYINQESKVIDLDGQTVIPGFIDGHAHLWNLGRFLINLDLTQIQNWDEVVSMVSAAAKKAKPGQWILGRGWHQEKWDKVPFDAVNGYPTHHSISEVSPDNPVRLKHASGHAIIVNQKAMTIAAITSGTTNPDGGIIVKDSKGEPTGVLLETAADIVSNLYDTYINTLNSTEKEDYYNTLVQKASQHALRNGITTFHDAGSYFHELQLLKKLAANNKLDIRLWAMISAEEILSDANLQEFRIVGFGNNFLTIRAIKQYADGALGSRGAWMLEPYSDMPSTSGLNVTPIDDIRKTAGLALKNGYQLCTHAIGDRGNREILDIYQSLLEKDKSKRWRIEHAQHLSLTDIPRFVELGIIASMQTVHCTSDGPWVPKRIGNKRAEEGAYVWQKLLKTNAKIANGTDAPVERISPIENYYSAVTRTLNDGSQFYPEQVLTRSQALASLTIWNAYAGFEEDIKGSIEVGKLADLVVLSQDILTVAEDKILETTINYTIVDGQIKYKRN